MIGGFEGSGEVELLDEYVNVIFGLGDHGISVYFGRV